MLQHNIIKASPIECEVVGNDVQNTEPIYIRATIQFVVPTEREYSLVLLEKLGNLESQLSVYANNINYLESRVSAMQDQNQEIARLTEVLHDTNLRLEAKDTTLAELPQWHSVSAVAEAKGLSSDAVRKQLGNGEFEDGVDFKKPNGKILIHQGAVERIHRRRSLNG